MGRRGQYFEQLEDQLSGRVKRVLIQLIKDCLHNSPPQRPTAEQLVTVLEGMKSVMEGCYGDLAMIDAVRHVKTMKVMKQNSDELLVKDEEIHHLQQQLEVSLVVGACRDIYLIYIFYKRRMRTVDI